MNFQKVFNFLILSFVFSHLQLFVFAEAVKIEPHPLSDFSDGLIEEIITAQAKEIADVQKIGILEPESNKQMKEYAARIINRLLNASDLLEIAQEDPHLIFLLSGNRSKVPLAGISNGIIKMTPASLFIAGNEDEFASVLAHELVHFIKRHGILLLSEKSKHPETSSNDKDRDMFSRVETPKWMLKLRKEQELEADRVSIELLLNAGYNPQASITAVRNVAHASPHINPKRSYGFYLPLEDRVKFLENVIADRGSDIELTPIPAAITDAINTYFNSNYETGKVAAIRDQPEVAITEWKIIAPPK